MPWIKGDLPSGERGKSRDGRGFAPFTPQPPTDSKPGTLPVLHINPSKVVLKIHLANPATSGSAMFRIEARAGEDIHSLVNQLCYFLFLLFLGMLCIAAAIAWLVYLVWIVLEESRQNGMRRSVSGLEKAQMDSRDGRKTG